MENWLRDNDDYLSTNKYWNLLDLEWGPQVDLDDSFRVEELKADPLFGTPGAKMSYYKKYPGITRSVSKIGESPYGLKAFLNDMLHDPESLKGYPENESVVIFDDSTLKEDSARIFDEVSNNDNSSFGQIKVWDANKSTRIDATKNGEISMPLIQHNAEVRSLLVEVHATCLELSEQSYLDSNEDLMGQELSRQVCDVINDMFIGSENLALDRSWESSSKTITPPIEYLEDYEEVLKQTDFEHSKTIVDGQIDTLSGIQEFSQSYSSEDEGIGMGKCSAESQLSKLARHDVTNGSMNKNRHAYNQTIERRETCERNVNHFEEDIKDSGEERDNNKFRDVKDFWFRLLENVPPPLSPLPRKPTPKQVESGGAAVLTNNKYDSCKYILEDNGTVNDVVGYRTFAKHKMNATKRHSLGIMQTSTLKHRASYFLETSFDGPEHETREYLDCDSDEESLDSFVCCDTPVLMRRNQSELNLRSVTGRRFLPPENDLQKNSDRVLSEHELRVQRSLQKLNVPDWYKNAPAPREGFLLRKRLSDASTAPAGRWTGLSSKTTSLGSLGGAPVPTPPSHPQLSPANTSFGRWSTSRLNSNQTSPCSSTRSSVRGGSACGASPLRSPSTRSSFSARQPYLGWRSQERLATSTPRTPHERLAISLLPQTPPSKASEEIRSSIKEVTSAIVHYVSGLEPHSGAPHTQGGRHIQGEDSLGASPRGSQKLYWRESSFVGTKPLESPQTPIVVTQSGLPPPHPRPPTTLKLERTAAPSTTEWQSSQRSLLSLGITRPSPGSTTLEDVLDSLLGLPAAPARVPSPQNTPRKSHSPYYILTDKTSRYDPYEEQTNSLPAINREKSLGDYEAHQHNSIGNHSNGDVITDNGHVMKARRRSSADSASSVSNLAPDTVDTTSMSSSTQLTKINNRRLRSTTHSDRRQSISSVANKTHSLDRRTSGDEPRNSDATNSDLSQSKLSDLRESKTSLKSITSLNTDISCEESIVKCKYSKCTAKATPSEAKRHYKNCHNCNYVYCSKECRRAHWERHRKVCLHSRASLLCRQILSTAKEDGDSLHHVSSIAYKGYLAAGRGVVKVIFTDPETAEKFTTHGFQYLGEPVFVRWPDLEPNEMGPELYSEVVKLCKSYNPETRVILYVAVCIVSEVPTEGAVKWERQLVSRCAKLRLSKTISLHIAEKSQMVTHSSPRAARRTSRDEARRSHRRDSIETLILASKSSSHNDRNTATSHKSREICFANIQKQLQLRGVSLKKHFPEVYAKLISYVDGTSDKFSPVTIYPKDSTSGRSFICVIMPELYDQDSDSLQDGSRTVHTVDIAIDTSLDQVSTPM